MHAYVLFGYVQDFIHSVFLNLIVFWLQGSFTSNKEKNVCKPTIQIHVFNFKTYTIVLMW